MLVNLIEEAYLLHENEKKRSETVERWDNTGNAAMRVAAGTDLMPGNTLIPDFALKTIGGYQAGKAIGHPVAGTLLGREAALGAASKHNDNISIGDVYSNNNMINRGLAAAGTLGGMAIGSEILYDDPTAIYDTDAGKIAGGIVATSPLYVPAISYGLGKVFGSKDPVYNKENPKPKS